MWSAGIEIEFMRPLRRKVAKFIAQFSSLIRTVNYLWKKYVLRDELTTQARIDFDVPVRSISRMPADRRHSQRVFPVVSLFPPADGRGGGGGPIARAIMYFALFRSVATLLESLSRPCPHQSSGVGEEIASLGLSLLR